MHEFCIKSSVSVSLLSICIVFLGSKERPSTARDPLDRVKKKKILKSSFFLDSGKQHGGDGTGTVYRKYPAPRPVRKSVAHPTIPDTEDQRTTKEVRTLHASFILYEFGEKTLIS